MGKKSLLNKNYSIQLIKKMLSRKKANDEKEKTIQQLWEYILIGNIKQLFAVSKSDSELLFLNTLYQESLKDELGLIYFAPTFNTTYELLNSYQNFEQLGSELKPSQKANKDITISWNIYYLFYQSLNLKEAYHLNTDIYLSDIIVESKPVRADLFIWKPANPDFKLVIQYHSRNKLNEALLKKLGYNLIYVTQVEFTQNPMKLAKKVLRELRKLQI